MRTESHQGGRNSSGGASASSTDSRKKGELGDIIFDVLQSTMSSPLPSSVVQVGTPPIVLDHWRSITTNEFVLSMVKVTISSLGVVLHYSVISNSLTLQWLWLTIVLCRRMWMNY